MKREDIDKKIGMPDIDEEWTKFECEVIEQEDEPKEHLFAPWAWAIGIAASIVLVAGLFLWDNKTEAPTDYTAVLTQETNVHNPTERHITNRDETERNKPGSIQSDNAAPNDKETQTIIPALQGSIGGMEIASEASQLRKKTIRVRGENIRIANDSVLVLIDGTAHPLSIFNNLTRNLYRHQQVINSIHVYKDDEAKQRYIEKYGDCAKNGVIEIITATDTLSEAYVRQHPEVQQCRRHVTGYVINEKTNKPIAFAEITLSRFNVFGTMTDSTGHFSFWPSLATDTLWAYCADYKTSRFHVADTALTIRLEPLREWEDILTNRRNKQKKDSIPLKKIRIRGYK